MEHPISTRFTLWLVCGGLFVAVTGYLSTGTMAPYANIHPRPLILKPCNYLLNPDNPHFVASYEMLDGAPRRQWDFSVVLRRTLFPVLAFPLMNLWGFFVGGVVTSLIVQVAAFAAFVTYVHRRIGQRAGLCAIVLLATYPGIYFWCGLPYCYAIIVPATLLATICTREIDRSTTLSGACLFAVLLGILFTGYDLTVFFAPPALIILLRRRRWMWVIPVGVLMLAPQAVNDFLLVHVAGVNFANENSRLYMTLISAWLHPPGLMEWARHVAPVFETFYKVFFFSNFTFLPALFLIAAGINVLRGSRRVRFERVELWVLLTALGLFLFINLAPPYQGWQFQGEGMSRIYQPVFAVMILHIARIVEDLGDRALRLALPWAIGAATVLNASIALGPITLNPLAGWAYNSFYRQADQPQLLRNLALFGRRPLGFCDESITLENAPPRRHGPKKLTRAQRQRLREHVR